MRIALLTDAWKPQLSGASLTLQKTADLLISRGHLVTVIHPGLFRTVPCPSYPEIRLAVRPLPKLSAILDEVRPEAIHIPVEGPIGWAGRRYCLSRGRPFTTAFMTRFPEYIRDRYRLPTAWTEPLFRRFHRPAGRTMVSTPSLKQELLAKGYEDLVIWGRGVDHRLFRPREKSLLDLPRPIAMSMGRVAVEKNLEDFLRLDLPGSKVVIGDGPALADLQRAFPEAIFLGRKTGEDLAAHLASADVFVFPSRTDTFGIVLVEAMACGLPVAAYPVVGPLDVVRHGRTGWLDWDLSTAIDRALTLDRSECRRYALGFSWQESVRQFEANLIPCRQDPPAEEPPLAGQANPADSRV